MKKPALIIADGSASLAAYRASVRILNSMIAGNDPRAKDMILVHAELKRLNGTEMGRRLKAAQDHFHRKIEGLQKEPVKRVKRQRKDKA